jgi:signal transduction histidine kinase
VLGTGHIRLEQSTAGTEQQLQAGLTLVKRLIDIHGGTVEARSDGPGKRSEFIVRLPVATNVVPSKSPAGTRRPRPRLNFEKDRLHEK